MRLPSVRYSSAHLPTFVTWTCIIAFSLLFILAAPRHASAQGRGKGMNFGGIPKPVLDEIVGVFSGTLQPGITQEMANKVLVRLIQEEHAAANPGPEVTGFMDAFLAFADLRAALKRVKEASESEAVVAVDALNVAIDRLGKLWTVGPPMPGFFSPEEEK